MKKSVCVDLDGTLADYSKGWQWQDIIGDPIPGAVEFTRKISEFARVIIYTTRCKGKLFDRDEDPVVLANIVKSWLDKHGFYYDEVDIGQGKPIASAYVDDRAVVCRPEMSRDPEATFKVSLVQAKHLCEVS